MTLLEEGTPKPVKTEEGTKTAEEQPSEGGGITLRILLEKDAPLKGIRSFLVLQEIEKRAKVLSTNPSRLDIQNGDLIDGHYFEVTLAPDANLDEIKEAVLKHPDVAGVEVVEPGSKPPEKPSEAQGTQAEAKNPRCSQNQKLKSSLPPPGKDQDVEADQSRRFSPRQADEPRR